MSQQPAQPAEASTWSKTKSGFSTVGKGANGARSGINNGLAKLDNMSISSKGLSFKKNLSGGNVTYDRDNHVVAPKMDVSHLPPPPRRIPGATPTTSTKKPATSTRPAAPVAAAKPVPARSPVPVAPRPTSARPVPPPPPARASKEELLPVYTPVPEAKPTPIGELNSRFGGLKTSSVPSMKEANTAMSSAKTVGGLYGKYGNQQPGQKTATPSWSEIKAGAAAANNLHTLHGKYAPKETNAPVVAPQPVKSVPAVRMPVPTPSPKPPLPKGKPNMGPPKDYCVGLFAFEAQSPGDLAFAVGDKIEVLERTDDVDAWWKGKLNGKEGIFPANYCRLEKA